MILYDFKGGLVHKGNPNFATSKRGELVLRAKRHFKGGLKTMDETMGG